MKLEKCSLIIATYNWPEALDLCLQSVLQQTHLPDEILIADDGSGNNTRLLIENISDKFPVPIVHIWHEDTGFRLAQIRNKAIAAAQYPYIIQIDGDLILDSHFIEDHLSFAEIGFFARGGRSILNEAVTKDIFHCNKLPTSRYLKKHCTNKLNSQRNLYIAKYLRHKYQVKGKNYYRVIGCNMAFWKKDLVRVNGYNEKIIGWGTEDWELAVRLLKSGIRKQSLKMAAVTFHLFHKGNSRENEGIHKKMLEKTITNNEYVSELGIDQYCKQ